MAEKDKVYKGRLVQAGVFNFKDYYEFLYETLVDLGYDVFEERYAETKKGDTKNVEITWRAEKSISHYFKYSLTLRWFVLGLTKVKVKQEGREVSIDSGSISVDFSADLIKDQNDEWRGTFWKVLRKIYDDHIINSRIENYELKLYEEINEIISHAKAFLAIEGQHEY